MKRLHFIAASALMLLVASCGTTESTTTSENYSTSNMAIVTAPDAVQTTFIARYPDATNINWYSYDNRYIPIDWDLTDWQVLSPQDYVVSYTLDNNNYYSWYDQNGNWVGSTYAVADYATLPAEVSTAVNEKFPGYTITGVQKEYWKDRTAYQLEMNNGSTKAKVLIDTNGSVIKQKTKDL